MPRIASHLAAGSDEFLRNREHMDGLVAELDRHLERARAGGGETAVERHHARGKLLARERIERLIDPGAAFLELSPLAAHGLYDDEAPAAGIVTGIGPVAGRAVRRRRQRRHREGRHLLPDDRQEAPAGAGGGDCRTGLPCIYLVDSGGAYLPLQAEVFPDRDHFGRIFYNQARMSAAGIPQIAVVMGSCTAGGAYVPAMSRRDRDRARHRARSSWAGRRS